MSGAWIFWGLFFGAVGFGFFIYGRKEKAVVPLVCGIALMVFPYFVSSILAIIVIGVVLTAVPYFIRT